MAMWGCRLHSCELVGSSAVGCAPLCSCPTVTERGRVFQLSLWVFVGEESTVNANNNSLLYMHLKKTIFPFQFKFLFLRLSQMSNVFISFPSLFLPTPTSSVPPLPLKFITSYPLIIVVIYTHTYTLLGLFGVLCIYVVNKPFHAYFCFK